MLPRIIIVLCVLQNCVFSENVRIKRAKYNSGPLRIYKPPPMLPFRGYTPFMEDDSPGRFPGKFKVSEAKEGLADEDFLGLIKHLSKRDFERIVEIASEKQKQNEYRRPDNIEIFRNTEQELIPSKVVFSNDDNFHDGIRSNYQFNSANNNVQNGQFNQGPIAYINSEDTKGNDFSFLNDIIQQEFNTNSNQEQKPESYKDTVYTNSETMKEEQLPKPQNLREDADFEIAYTNNVPSIVQSDSSSYKLENFASLPLMNYENSKLDSQNSYNVPHYTVTSTRSQSPSASFPSPPSFSSPNVQPAPNKSAAALQSDAHLKAVKIWTHKSTGTAYTLHDDGTLSLEKPFRPKRKF